MSRINPEEVLEQLLFQSSFVSRFRIIYMRWPWFLSGISMDNPRTAEGAGVLKEYRALDSGTLLATGGVWYHASQKVRCGHCRHITKDREKTYYHSTVAGAVVRPGSMRVIPVVPESIRNEDGEEAAAPPNHPRPRRPSWHWASARHCDMLP
jgi:hypothetical protein